MESLILTGSGITGSIVPPSGLGVEVKDVQLDVPLDEIGTTDPYMTLSGVTTGARTLHGDQKVNIRYRVDETVNITTANFTSEYSAILNYVYYNRGGQEYWKELRNIHQLPLPARLTRNPRNGS